MSLFTELPVALPTTSSHQQDETDFVFAKNEFPDKSLFNVTIQHPAISAPIQRTAQLRKLLKDHLVKGTKNTFTDKDDDRRRILVLKTDTSHSQLKTTIGGLDDKKKDSETIHWISEFPVTRTYNDQSADELLRRLLPESIIEIPSSFELVGTIAHLNLKQECHPYKYWIGQILLDRNSSIKTVVNKVGTIDTVYRTFSMEILAGNSDDNWSCTTVHEHGHSFQLDYQHVYWNSRLSGEHKRLVDLIVKEQEETENRSLVVADLMAGVGPFAVPLTTQRGRSSNDNNNSHGVIVYANDLNPVSFKYLQINAKANKCRNLHCYNIDARAFLHQLQSTTTVIDHVIMNLPASAPEFLDAFRGWSLQNKLPTIHVHCFAPKKSDAGHAETIRRCEQALGCEIRDPIIHIVRNVSPSNNMLCVSFQLPVQASGLERIALAKTEEDDDNQEAGQPNSKRAKIRVVDNP